jgi:DNA topoisomerase IA
MAELLVVVDSEAKADFMKDYYGERAFCIICTEPLFRTSHQVSPEAASGLLFRFDALPTDQHCLDTLHEFQNKAILLAMDGSDLANFLCWQISSYVAQIGGRPDTVKRLSLEAFSKETMDKALHSAGTVDAMLGLPSYSHQLFDDCLAHHLIRLIGTDHGPGNLPLCKNSLTTLFLLAEREHERTTFPPSQTWQVQAKLAIPAKDTSFTVSLTKGLNLPADGLSSTEAKARTLSDQFRHTPFRVESNLPSPLTITTPKPYQLAELLHDATILFGLQPIATMTIVKKLFHGVPVHGKLRGLISSPVESPQPLDHETVSPLRQQVATLYGKAALHDCTLPTLGMIIPIIPQLSTADLTKSLSHEEVTLYDLILQRALASQMHPALGTTVTIDFLAGKEHLFQAQLHELNEPGFLQTSPLELAKIQTPIPIEEITEGKEFKPITLDCEQIIRDDQGGEHYTVKTLLAALSDFSIPPDLPTITMLDSIIQAGYATLSKHGYLEAAENTFKVVSILARAFPQMQGINLAAYIEQTINEATSARKDLPFALKQFDQTLTLHGKILIKAKSTAKVPPRARTSSSIIKQTTATIGLTSLPPDTNNSATLTQETPPLMEAPPDFEPQSPGPELSAIAAWTEPLPAETTLVEELTEEDRICPSALRSESQTEDTHSKLHSKEYSSKHSDRDREGKRSSDESVLQYAEQQHSAADNGIGLNANWNQQAVWGDDDLKKTFAEALSETSPPADTAKTEPSLSSDGITPTGIKLACPLCSHALNRQQTPTGKSFYVCGHQECQFMSWSIPHYLPCELCNSPYLVEKNIQGISQLRCPRAGCTYSRPLSEENMESREALSVPATKKILVRRVAPGSTTTTATKKVRIVRRRA